MPKYKRPTPEEAAAGRARTLETERAILSRIEQQYGKLPEAKTWTERHPSIGQFIPESVSSAIGAGTDALGAGADSLLRMMGFGEQPVQYGLDAQGRPLSTQFGVKPTQNETVVPKTSKQSVIRKSMLDAISPVAPAVNKRFAIGDDEAESVLHGFMDSKEGRALGAVTDQKEFLDKARTGYTRFAQKWAGVGDGEARLKIDDAAVFDADTATAKEVADAFAANKATVVKNASRYGFDSDEIVIKGDGKTNRKPEAILSANRPIMTKGDFIDVLKYMRGSTGG